MLIAYKGFRPRHADKLYGTGEWEQGQTKDVPDKTGRKLLGHADMFGEGKPGGKVVIVADTAVAVAKAKELDEMKAMELHDAVAAMLDKQAVLDFAHTTYGHKLNGKLKLDELKRQADGLIDQFGA